jgi:hypothetical protein
MSKAKAKMPLTSQAKSLIVSYLYIVNYIQGVTQNKQVAVVVHKGRTVV